MKLKGWVTGVKFQKGFFFIGDFSVNSRATGRDAVHVPRNITFRGNLYGLLNVRRDTSLELVGEWVVHPKYGSQLAVESWEPWAEESADRAFFLNTCVEGFHDAVFCRKIVEAHGSPLFELLTKDPEQITATPIVGFTAEQVESAVSGWQKLLAAKGTALLMQQAGLSTSLVEAVIGHFGAVAPVIIQENPYRLLEVPGFNFRTVDRLGQKLGIDANDVRRREGAVLWAIWQATTQGHLFLKRGELGQHVVDVTTREHTRSFEDHVFDPDVDRLVERGSLLLERGTGVYVPTLYKYERDSARILAEMVIPSKITIDLGPFLDEYERSNRIELSSSQRDAVAQLADKRVLVLTGLPGTGKTTVVKALVRLLETAGFSFELLAPTGIAAKRLGAVVGRDAFTIHRRLKFNGSEWGHHADNRLTGVDAVIVDEMSMVDQELLYRLLISLQPDTMLVLVGDDAQLPSVGAGNVLKELVNCPVVPRVRLTQIFRQSHKGAIVQGSHAIDRGEMPELGDPKGDSELKFVRLTDEAKIREVIVSMAVKLKQRDANFQVLSPKYQGDVGVDKLNEALRECLNPSGPQEWRFRSPGSKEEDLTFRVGDRLMVVRNDYQREVYNGDMGKLHAIDSGQKRLVVRVHGAGERGEDSLVEFPFDEAPDKLQLAYAITVHKCLHPDTLIDTPNGLLPIREASAQGLVWTPEGIRPYTERIDGVQTLCEVRTKEGYRLRATPEHGVDVWDPKQGYVRIPVGELQKGDFVRLALTSCPVSNPPPALPIADLGSDSRCSSYRIPTEFTPDLAEFLGFMVADGTLYKRGFRLLKRHLDVVDRFAILGQLLFGLFPHRGFKEGGHYAEFNSVPVAQWLAEFKGILPWAKEVPAYVLQSGPTHRARFLRALFEDGSVHLRSDGCLDHIELSSAYPELLHTVRVMLLGFGIVCSTYEKPGKTPRLWIYGEYAKRFGSAIGFTSAFKCDRLEAPAGDLTRYLVPVSRAEVDALVEVLGGRGQLNHSDKNVYQRGYFSVHHLLNMLGRVPIEAEGLPLLRELRDRATLFHHTRVAKVAHLGEQATVCLHVPDGHRFIQDGFSAWNSQGSEFDVVIIPIVNSQGWMLQRNLIYTGITRARRQVWLLGEERAILRAIENNQVRSRNSVLGKAVVTALDGVRKRDAEGPTGPTEATGK